MTLILSYPPYFHTANFPRNLFAMKLRWVVSNYCQQTGLKYLLAVAAIVPFLLSTDAKSETLEDAVRRALTGSPELNTGELLLMEAEEGITRAKSAWKPEVNLSVRGGRKTSTSDTEGAVTTNSFNPLSATVSVSQHLLDFGETNAGIQKSRILKEISREQLRQTKQGLIKAAVLAYLGVWRDNHLFKVSKNNEYNLERQFHATEKRFSLREVTRTDLSQATARFQNAISARIEAELVLQESLAKYVETIGPIKHVDDISWSREGLVPYPIPETLEKAHSTAYLNNSEMKDMRLQHELARYTILERRSDLMPKISLEASVAGSQDPSSSIDASRNLSLEGVLTVPLYDAGVSRSNLDSAKIQARIVVETERQKKLVLDRKILSLWNTLNRVDSQISSTLSSVAANKVALEGVRREVEVGTRTTLNLLDAENEYVQSEANLISAVYEETQSHFSLLFECGLLAEALFPNSIQ